MTKKERNIYYKVALKYLDDRYDSGLCRALLNATSFTKNPDKFEEFLLFRPRKHYNHNNYWFDMFFITEEEKKQNYLTRRLILEFCIEMTKT